VRRSAACEQRATEAQGVGGVRKARGAGAGGSVPSDQTNAVDNITVNSKDGMLQISCDILMLRNMGEAPMDKLEIFS
jgi:hypothetical protein